MGPGPGFVIMGEVWRTPAGIVPAFELSMTGRCGRLTRSSLAAALEQTRSSEPQKIREERCWSQIQKSPSPFATIGHIPKEMLHLHVCGGIGTLWILLCNLNGEIRAGRQNSCTWVTPGHPDRSTWIKTATWTERSGTGLGGSWILSRLKGEYWVIYRLWRPFLQLPFCRWMRKSDAPSCHGA